MGAGEVRLQDDSETDIGPISNAGVPAFSPWQDERRYFIYHHTAADTLDKIDPSQLKESSAVTAVLTYALASLSGPLPRRTPPPKM
jgi:Zn-dependent M28 family amino/carboxypeptidase